MVAEIATEKDAMQDGGEDDFSPEGKRFELTTYKIYNKNNKGK